MSCMSLIILHVSIIRGSFTRAAVTVVTTSSGWIVGESPLTLPNRVSACYGKKDERRRRSRSATIETCAARWRVRSAPGRNHRGTVSGRPGPAGACRCWGVPGHDPPPAGKGDRGRLLRWPDGALNHHCELNPRPSPAEGWSFSLALARGLKPRRLALYSP